MDELLRRRDAGEPISGPYIARLLMKGAQVEGLELKCAITDANVLRYIRRRNEKVRPRG